MIDFTAHQLTWIVLGACSIGGTGYITMNSKMEDMSTKVAVIHNNVEHNIKTMDELRNQLNRIEEKIDNNKKNK
jgi:hypothetical protein